MDDRLVKFKGRLYVVNYSEKDGEYTAFITLDNLKHISVSSESKEFAKLKLEVKLYELEEKAEARKLID